MGQQESRPANRRIVEISHKDVKGSPQLQNANTYQKVDHKPQNQKADYKLETPPPAKKQDETNIREYIIGSEERKQIQERESSAFFHDFPNSFVRKEVSLYGVYGYGLVYQHKESKDMVIEKQYNIRNPLDEQVYAQRLVLNLPNVIKQLCEKEQQNKTFYGPVNHLYICYEFIPHTLYEEIQIRQRDQVAFYESDIWYAMLKICVILTECKSYAIYHMDLRPWNVLLDKFGNVKLSPMGIFPEDQNCIQKFLLHNVETHIPYQFMQQVMDGEPITQWDQIDVYGLGATLMNMMSCQNRVFKDKAEIQAFFAIYSKYYTPQLISLVESLVLFNPIEKPLIEDLYLLLIPHIQDIQEFKRFVFDPQNTKPNLNTSGHSMSDSRLSSLSYHDNQHNISPQKKEQLREEYINQYQNAAAHEGKVQQHPNYIQGQNQKRTNAIFNEAHNTPHKTNQGQSYNNQLQSSIFSEHDQKLVQSIKQQYTITQPIHEIENKKQYGHFYNQLLTQSGILGQSSTQIQSTSGGVVNPQYVSPIQSSYINYTPYESSPNQPHVQAENNDINKNIRTLQSQPQDLSASLVRLQQYQHSLPNVPPTTNIYSSNPHNSQVFNNFDRTNTSPNQQQYANAVQSANKVSNLNTSPQGPIQNKQISKP